MKNKSSMSFIDKLRKHQLTINEFLDLRDEWDTISSNDRKTMLEDELKRENPKVERVL